MIPDNDSVYASVFLPQHLDEIADGVGHGPKDEYTTLVSEKAPGLVKNS